MARANSSFRFLWITDSWDSLDHPHDTTLRLAQEASALGYENHWCDYRAIRWQNGSVVLPTRRLTVSSARRSKETLKLGPIEPSGLGDFQSVHYRTDPPVDLGYLHPLQLLQLAAEGMRRSPVVNPLEVLMMANEKLEASLLGDLMPPGIAGSQWEALLAFGRAEGRTVLKPLHCAQSRGVELLDWRSPAAQRKAREKIEKATDGFMRPILLQRYLEGIREGETRLWFLDGALLAHVRKLPLAGDFRVDIDRGSRLEVQPLTPAERKIASAIGRLLRKKRVRLAAVDLIEGYVTDFNFTSPGLIVQMEAVLGVNLARPIIRALTAPARR
ncbi:MAG: hypothetical protein NDJ90_12710 [Oligoflexia bacterium]|nr:hypothetical protein [Oligoflexia bacterium]